MGQVIHIPKLFGPREDKRGYFDPREQAVDDEFGFLYGPCPDCVHEPGYTCERCGFYCERCICLPKADEVRKPVYVRQLEASLQPDADGTPRGLCGACGLPVMMHEDVSGIVWVGCDGARTRKFMGLYENRPATR